MCMWALTKAGITRQPVASMTRAAVMLASAARMNSFDYFAPDSLPEVFDLLGKYGEDAKLIAGGTALVILMRQNLVRPSVVVSLRRLRELGGIEAENGGVGGWGAGGAPPGG